MGRQREPGVRGLRATGAKDKKARRELVSPRPLLHVNVASHTKNRRGKPFILRSRLPRRRGNLRRCFAVWNRFSTCCFNLPQTHARKIPAIEGNFLLFRKSSFFFFSSLACSSVSLFTRTWWSCHGADNIEWCLLCFGQCCPPEPILGSLGGFF